ncbi:unnamed protein product [Agarophyton chilense]
MGSENLHYVAWKDKKDGTACIRDDRYLEPFAEALRYRYAKFNELLSAIESSEKSLEQFSRGYETMGIHRVEGGVRYREWAPSAREMYFFGEFNNWDRHAIRMERDEFGIWSCFIPETEAGVSPIPHGSKVKAAVVPHQGPWLDRNPAWATYCVQDPNTYLYDTVFWDPPEKFKWSGSDHVKRPESLRIYECHIGMGTNDLKVGSYREFADNVLPRIKDAGYTALQIMAIMEHAYYASFGYHVTNFFAISSRCGEPEDLKYLIDKAHQLGLYVLMDVVHSHASSNSMDGINNFDGTDHHYFHEGERGRHSLWDSRLFNYGHWEVIRFLLSNLRWYMEEYHFDGFRFDGVTSMLYLHSGIGVQFTGNYGEYFGFQVDVDACVYMMLANKLVHDLYPDVAVTIAEDVSGMPTLCVPVERGGLGFDFRLAMAIPDMWIETLEKQKDENWNMGNIVFTLTNRRWNEKTIGYCESHDQALVGDKTIAFWLMDAAMYTDMSCDGYPTPVIERGIALHKMIRLLTMCLSGEGYLTFMGNEFGHPEWVDFPREGNGNSYQHARRRWDLCDNEGLRYKHLYQFEKLIHALDSAHPFCRFQAHQYVVLSDEGDKVIAVEKGDRLLFVFNFHHSQSYSDYRIGTYWGGRYKLVLDSDGNNTGGHGRVHWDVVHNTRTEQWHNRPYYLQIYTPARTCQVYHCYETWEEEREKGDRESHAAKKTESGIDGLEEKMGDGEKASTKVEEVSSVAAKIDDTLQLNGSKNASSADGEKAVVNKT